MSHAVKRDALPHGNGSDRTPQGQPGPSGAVARFGRSSERYAFWIVFAFGWLGWIAVMALPSALAGEPVGPPIASTVGPILFGTLVAGWRRELLRPGAPLVRTVLTHLGVGVAYAVASAFLSALLAHWIAPPGELLWNHPLLGIFTYLCVVHAVLYVVLAGYLMWTESIRHVRESQARLAHEAVLRTQAEAKALRAQFNPHFVLNALHSLMALVREEPETAERAIEDVGALIRYAAGLARYDRDTVPLREEITIAERYLALEGLRLGDRLTVAWDIRADPGLYDVPSFSLQSLLENAITHGVSPQAAGGAVRIGISVEGEYLVMSVEDDGLGADPKVVMDAQGRGLDLLTQRLGALYGPDASLTWSTEPANGFSVRCAIPLARAVRAVPHSASGTPSGTGRHSSDGGSIA